MLLLVLATVILGAIWIWILISPNKRHREMAKDMPGPTSYPIVGNIFNFIIQGPKAPKEWEECIKKYGRSFRVWLGPQLHMFLTDPDDMQMILSSQNLITKGESYATFGSWLGSGLLLSTGELWQKRRRAITPTFHFKILEEFVPTFNKCAKILVECLKDKVGKEPFLLTNYMSNCSLDVVAETAMGTELKAQTNPLSEYPASIFKMTITLMERIVNPLLGMEPLYTLTGRKKKENDLLKILFSLPMEVINKKKNSISVNTNGITESNEVLGIRKKTAFLELLLKMKDEKVPAFQTDQDVKDEVVTFMFEGHDTTTMALTFIVWLLGYHQDIQEKVYEEVSSILVEEESSMEDYQKMSYLERVIKEGLRLYPSVPTIARIATQDIVLPSCGMVVPAGANLNLVFYSLHRHEDLFPSPEKFDPDRFLEPQKHPFAYLPFSAGPRNCIGQKFAMLDMKVVISTLILNYKIKSIGGVAPSPEIILRSDEGPFITVTPRN